MNHGYYCTLRDQHLTQPWWLDLVLKDSWTKHSHCSNGSQNISGDPKERLDICPAPKVPKLAKIADLQAHNMSLCVPLRACRLAVFTTS